MTRRTIFSGKGDEWQTIVDDGEDPNIPWSHVLGTPYEKVKWQRFSSAPYTVTEDGDRFIFEPYNDPAMDRNFYTFNRWGNIAEGARSEIPDMLHSGKILGATMSNRWIGKQTYVARLGPPRTFVVYRIPIGR